MTITRRLAETATLASESANADGSWKVRLISEGKGSSGIYTRELLEQHGNALDESLSFKNHPTGWDGPQERDFTMLAGQVVGTTWLEEHDGKLGVYANYLPDQEYRSKLEQYKNKLGLSIFIEGSGHIDESDGEFYVDWLNREDPYKSVDVVIAPGARGRFLESMRDEFYTPLVEGKNPAASSAQDTERKSGMEKEDLEAIKAAFAEALAPLLSVKEAEAEKSAQVEADDAAVAARVATVTSNLDAVEAAREELFPKQVESLRAEAKSGADITARIAEAKQIRTDALEAAGQVQTVVEGRAHTDAGDKGFSLKQIAGS